MLYKRTRKQFVVKQIPKKHHCPKKFLVTRLKRYTLKLETNFFLLTTDSKVKSNAPEGKSEEVPLKSFYQTA